MITMRRIVRAVPLITLAPMLAVTVRAAPPPEPQPLRVEVAAMGILLRVESTVPIQGQLTDSAGHPVADADYNMTFRVRDNAAAVLCTVGPTAVHTEKGLFNASLTGCPADIFDGQFLSLGIQVGGDAEMTPGLPIRPVPYAMSLRPGATINNQDAGRGLTVKSGQTGQAGTALWAENTNPTAGIGLWAKAAGEDATVISTNVSTGALFKGFGSDGGEDEFRVQNDGAIETKADSYVFIPGDSMIALNQYPEDLIVPAGEGSVTYDAGSAGTRQVTFSAPIPAMLYGQPTELEDITVYLVTYGTSYVTHTRLTVLGSDGSAVVTVADETDHSTGSVYDHFTLALPENTSLSADAGILCIRLHMSFPDASGIRIGGVRIQLGHHDLY